MIKPILAQRRRKTNWNKWYNDCIHWVMQQRKPSVCPHDTWGHICINKQNRYLGLSHYSSHQAVVMHDLWYMQAGVTTAGRPKGRLAWQLRWIDVLLMTACLWNGRWSKQHILLRCVKAQTHINVFVCLYANLDLRKPKSTSLKKELDRMRNKQHPHHCLPSFLFFCFRGQ